MRSQHRTDMRRSLLVAALGLWPSNVPGVFKGRRNMRINDLSPLDLKDFHNALGKRFGVTFVNSGPMAALAKAMINRACSGLLDTVPASLLRLRPMCAWKFILLPYKPGDRRVPARVQVTTAIHEVLHFVRMRNDKLSVAQWYASYFDPSYPEFRALEEGSAWESVADVLYWAEGKIPSISLEGYFLTDDEMGLAHKSYNQRKKQLFASHRGKTFDPVSSSSIRILDSLGVTKS